MAKKGELTPKQSIFVNVGKPDFNATRSAISAGYSPKTAGAIGAENLTKPLIAAEIKKRQAVLADAHDITLKSLLDELDEARSAALGADTVQSSAAVAATMAKAKLCGLIVDKQDTKASGTVTHMIVAEAPKLSKEEWLKVHKMGA